MQLSTSHFSSETNLAALLLAGICPAGLPATANTTGAGQDACDFSQLLPSLGGDPAVASATIGAGTAAPLNEMFASPPAEFPQRMLAKGGSLPTPGLPPAMQSNEPPSSKPDCTPLAGGRRERPALRAGFASSAVPLGAPMSARKSAALENGPIAAPAPDALALVAPLPPALTSETPDSEIDFVPDDGEAGMPAFGREEKSPVRSPESASNRGEPAAEMASDSQAHSPTFAPSRVSVRAPALNAWGRENEPGPDIELGADSTAVASPSARTTLGAAISSANEDIAPAFSSPTPAADVATRAPQSRAMLDFSGIARGDTAKIAVPSNGISVEKNSSISVTGKSFLTGLNKRLTWDEPNLGIGVAEGPATMSAATFSPRASSSALAHDPAAATSVVESGNSIPEQAASPAETVSTAHRAVEVVLRTAEHAASRHASSVNLQFSVGGEDLSVRVELRANEVHATFRTDSAELRAALSQEWQNVSSAGERPVRLAAPVFAAAEANAFSSSSGDTASQQRDSHARRAEQEFAAMPAVRPAPAPSLSSAPAVAATPVNRAGNSLHLHTLA